MKRTTMLAMALASILLAFNPALADVIIGSSNTTATVNVQAGGGATPVVIGPESDISDSLGANTSASKSIDSGPQDAHDAVPNYRGTSQGSGSASGFTGLGGLTLTGSGSASALTSSTGDLAQSLANATTTFDIYFEVTGSTVGYTFSGTLTDNYESPDQIKLERLSPAPGPLKIINNVQPSLSNSTGSLVVGNYHLFGNINANEISGPNDLGPDSEYVAYFFSLIFDSGTVVYEAPEPGAGLLLITPATVLMHRRRREC